MKGDILSVETKDNYHSVLIFGAYLLLTPLALWETSTKCCKISKSAFKSLLKGPACKF